MTKQRFGHHPNYHQNQDVRSEISHAGHRPIVSAEINGIEMGILQDGTPFLTLRGLATMCGIDHAPLLRLANNWGEEVARPRGQKILSLLQSQGHDGDLLYIRVLGSYGESINAFSDAVCMAILEYYAFEAGRYATEKAKHSFRALVRKSFRDFIYQQCGYDPANAVPAQWQPFHDRASLLYNSVPDGYFGIFHAISDLFIALGRSGIHTDQSFLPDISVGKQWSTHWQKISGDDLYGVRIRYEHDYPSSYSQSLSNPQEPWAYPDASLPEFKRWFREDYVKGGKLAGYLSGQAAKKTLPAPFINSALAAFGLPANAPKIERPKRSA